MRNATDVEISRIDHNYAFSITLKYEDKLKENEKIYIQIATLYTNLQGSRCIRLINYALNPTSKIAQVFKNADLDSCLSVIMRSGLNYGILLFFRATPNFTI